MSPSGGSNGCNPNSAEIRHIQMSNNSMGNMSSGNQVLAHQHTTPVSATGRFITFRSNLMQNVGYAFENTGASTVSVSLNIDFGRYASFINFVNNTHDIGSIETGKISDFGWDGGVQGGPAFWKKNVHVRANPKS